MAEKQFGIRKTLSRRTADHGADDYLVVGGRASVPAYFGPISVLDAAVTVTKNMWTRFYLVKEELDNFLKTCYTCPA